MLTFKPFFRRSSPAWAAVILLLGGCYRTLPSKGGGQAKFSPPRKVETKDIALPDGYEIEAVATGLTFPSGITFDDEGRVYVTEAGFSYGGYFGEPRLLRLEPSGTTSVVATGTNPPWNGVDYHDGSFYVAGGHQGGGQVLRVAASGQIDVIVDDLPSYGDHHTNGPLIGADGLVYFGQGTATNAAVVGLDSAAMGWLAEHPEFHDKPCRDIISTGRNFKTANPLTSAPHDKATTGAFVPFGTSTEAGQVVPGGVPCSGAVMRVRPDGTNLELVAWGLRNPFGLAWAPGGALYVADNEYDDRGSRPVWGTGDLLWRIEEGAWYGWPDFWSGQPLAAQQFKPPGGKKPQPLMREHPTDQPPKAVAVLGVHSSSNGLDFATTDSFGYRGQAFIAQFGDMAPGVGKVLAPVGFKVVRVDVETGVIHDFAVNRGRRTGPASLLDSGGLERPVAVRFDPAGEALYVVDFGVMTIHGERIEARPETGVIWRITREVQ